MASEFKLAPSILSADFSELGEALQLCAEGGAHYIHVDVMDNQFVPNLTIGPPVVKSLRPLTQKYMDIHMMVIEPEKLVEPFAKAGADGITFHIEAAEKPQEVIDLIRASGKDVGLSLKPKTPVADIEPFLDQIDLLLIMSVEPGFGGQGYVDGSTERVAEIKQLLIEKCLKDRVKIEVDGGIKLHNAKEVLDAGADILVVGSEVFKAEDPVGMMRSFYELANS
ncbi:MAG TPA: ribulose-phosphate 3-epimerase [Candidatus Marinimicrobia bacterium]|nr:ribulose-phosphate 3-epimerase [Candidatus Neomarinimicrobiota bacterium]